MENNGRIPKRAKLITIYAVQHEGEEGTVEIECPPNKALVIEALCDALKIASNLEFKKPIIQEPGQFIRLFKR